MGDAQLSFGPFVLHPGRELRRDGKPLAIGQRGLMLLETLLHAGGNAVSKTEIMDRVWPGLIVEDGNITVQIAGLRKELGKRQDGSEWTPSRASATASNYPPKHRHPHPPPVAAPRSPYCPSST